MKQTKVEDFDFGNIPYCQTYELKIKTEYPITHYFRTAENLKNKLQDYLQFEIQSIKENKKSKTYTIEIKGKITKEIQRKTILKF